jgi:2'-5' RNA ligase
MRVFVGLDIDPAIRQRMTRYLEGVRGFAPEARWVKPESFHVTLKFIGEQKDELVEEIKRQLATVRGQPFEVSFRGQGFFPNARSPRVFWLGIEAGEQLRQLAKAVDEAVARTGVERETNDYRPHLTLARSGSGRPQPIANSFCTRASSRRVGRGIAKSRGSRWNSRQSPVSRPWRLETGD